MSRGYIGHTKTGLVMGTPGYMSPEQARGKAVTGAADIYSLGCIGFELLTGAQPYEADNVMDVVIMHVQDPVPSCREQRPEVSHRLDRLIVRMMHKVADKRPSVAEIRAELAAIAARIPVTSKFSTLALSTPVPPIVLSELRESELQSTTEVLAASRGRRWPAILGSALGVAAVAVLAAMFLGSESTKPEPTAVANRPAPAIRNTGTSIPQPAQPSIGSVTVTTPPAAAVYLDDEFKADSDGTVELADVPPGRHLVRVQKSGFKPLSRWIQVEAGASVTVAAQLKPDPIANVEGPGNTRAAQKPRRARPERSTTRKPSQPKAEANKPQTNKPKRGKDYTLNPFE